MFVETKEAGEVTEAPAKLEDWQRTLLTAANLIESCGWVQGHLRGFGGYCALGGIYQAVHYRMEPYFEASNHLLKGIGGDYISVPTWNDEPGRTKDEVVAKLRAVALGL